MDSASEDILLQKIEELVFDEDQIVTNSVLCEKLNVSLTESKLLMQKFVSDQLLSPGKISVTYLLCGKLKKEKYGIQITEATSLEAKKKLFSNITNEIVYSIQKSNNIDFNLIAILENRKNENSKATVMKGSIVSEKCTECMLKAKVLPPLPPPKNFEKQKPSCFFKPVSKPNFSKDVEKNILQAKSVKDDVKTQNMKKFGKLASFFSQSNIKKENSSGDEDKNLKRPKEEHSEEKLVPKNKAEFCSEEKIENTIEKENFISKKNGNINLQKDVISVVNKIPEQEPKKRKNDEGRKRKRIIIESDSDDDLFGNVDEKMVLDKSDEEQEVAIQAQVPSISVPKNKRRKAIEKTYEDEEGYIVTRTEYVLVSASEDEEENNSESQKKTEITKEICKIEPKEEKKSLTVAKGASKKKGKALDRNQSSIMNFFTKK